MPTSTLLVGPHKLLHGDLTAGAVSDLMGEERADVVYVDPPWGPAMLTAFATQAGGPPRLPWPRFLDALAATIAAHRQAHAPVFVEMGLRWVDDLERAMATFGLEQRQRWDVLYGPKSRPRPQAILLFGPKFFPALRVELPDPPRGEDVTHALLAAVVRPGTVVLDPCAGLGMTARCTAKLGGHFRGVELVEARLLRTHAWLVKHQAVVNDMTTEMTKVLLGEDPR